MMSRRCSNTLGRSENVGGRRSRVLEIDDVLHVLRYKERVKGK